MRLLYADTAYVKSTNGKKQNKPKLNLTVREEQRNKLEQMASLENRSVSNLIEVMADERWKRLADTRAAGCDRPPTRTRRPWPSNLPRRAPAVFSAVILLFYQWLIVAGFPFELERDKFIGPEWVSPAAPEYPCFFFELHSSGQQR